MTGVFIMFPASVMAGFPGTAGIDDGTTMLAMGPENNEDRQELMALLTVLEEETKIATKSKMNNDYVPGMVTVLHGDHLETLGIGTVAEALSMVPGIQVSYGRTGEPSAKVRGIAFPFNAGNIKIMMNSIALSRESSGMNSSVLLVPVSQVDRIEVIRGPGSSIYGDFAMSGVVNIITRHSGSRVYSRMGNDDAQGAGGHYTYAKNGVKLNMNMSVADAGHRAAAVSMNPDEKKYLGVFHVDYNTFSFTAQGIGRQLDFYGRAGPQGRQDQSSSLSLESGELDEIDWVMEGRQRLEMGRNASLEAYVSYLHNDGTLALPPSEFDGDRVEAGIDLTWQPMDNHQLLFGVSYAVSDIDHAFQLSLSQKPIAISGIRRENYSLGIQDQITVTERFTLTVGGRYDHYDDVGSLFTPRIAGVYRLGEPHVIKAQYAKGFRAPTFFELYWEGTPDDSLDFEVIETTELGYVYRRPNMVGRATLFYSKIEDGLYPDDGVTRNIVDIESKGIELEWEQKIGKKLRWLANISCTDIMDERSGAAGGNQGLGTADWLGNLTVFFEPLCDYMVTGRLLFVGKRHTSEGSKDGYETVDLTLSRTNLFNRDLTLRVGVKNLLDESIIYLNEQARGLTQYAYEGRTFWLQLSYSL